MNNACSPFSLPFPLIEHSGVSLPVELVEEIIQFVRVLLDSDVACLALLHLAFSCHHLSITALGELCGRFQHSLLPLINILGGESFVRYQGIGVRLFTSCHSTVY